MRMISVEITWDKYVKPIVTKRVDINVLSITQLVDISYTKCIVPPLYEKQQKLISKSNVEYEYVQHSPAVVVIVPATAIHLVDNIIYEVDSSVDNIRFLIQNAK